MASLFVGLVVWTLTIYLLPTEILGLLYGLAGSTVALVLGTFIYEHRTQGSFTYETNVQASSGIFVSGNTISNSGALSNSNESQTRSVFVNLLSSSGSGGNTMSLPVRTS